MTLLETIIGLSVFGIFCSGVASLIVKTTQTTNNLSAKAAALDESTLLLGKISTYLQKRNVYSSDSYQGNPVNSAHTYYSGLTILLPNSQTFVVKTTCMPLPQGSPLLGMDFSNVGVECLDTPCGAGSAPAVTMIEPGDRSTQFPHISGSTVQRPVAMALCFTVPAVVAPNPNAQSQFDVFTTIVGPTGLLKTSQKNMVLPMASATSTAIMYLP